MATLSLHSLFELRSLLTNGTVMLDMEASNLEEIADLVCDNMVNAGSLPIASREKVRESLLLRHRHQHEREPRKRDNNMSRLPIIRNLADIGRNHSSSKSMLTIFLSNYSKVIVEIKMFFNTHKKRLNITQDLIGYFMFKIIRFLHSRVR